MATLTFDEYVPVQTPPEAPAVGVDVGIANFITTSTGKRYGTFHGKLAERHKRDREKRRRKAKLRTCLEKKGTARLPSTASTTLLVSPRTEGLNLIGLDEPADEILEQPEEHLSMHARQRASRHRGGEKPLQEAAAA